MSKKALEWRAATGAADLEQRAKQQTRSRRGSQATPASGPAREAHRQLALEALRKFRQVLRSVKKHFTQIEAQCGVSGAELWVMWELVETPGLRVSDLAEALSIKQPTASNLLDKLQQRKLIGRKRGEPDNRVVRLHLTKRGEELIARAPMPAQGVLPYALSNLPGSVLKDLDANLAQVLRQMKIMDKAAAMKPLSDLLS